MSNEPNKPTELTEKELECVVGGGVAVAPNIRYAIDEKGVKVAFPTKTDDRAGS